MAKYSNLSSLFTAIANAIRAKKGTTAEIVADNFPEEIAGIEAGSDIDLSVVTATSGDVLTPKVFIDSEGKTIVGSIATKSNSNLSVSGKSISGPAGYYSGGISKSIGDGALSDSVTISVDSSTGEISASSGVKTAGYLSTSKTTSGTKQLTTFNKSTAFTPGKTEQTIVNSGVYTLSPVKIAGDSNLDPSNIKSGVNIFGVTGEYGPGGIFGSGFVIASAGDNILYIASVNGIEAVENLLDSSFIGFISSYPLGGDITAMLIDRINSKVYFIMRESDGVESIEATMDSISVHLADDVTYAITVSEEHSIAFSDSRPYVVFYIP